MKYVIIGASAAGINAAKTLRFLDKLSEIIIISEDTLVYSRCMLHHIISGHRTTESLSFIEKDFFEKHNIQWIKGIKVVDLDIDNKLVKLEKGQFFTYDKLLIASGASASIPPIKNLREAKSVYCLRNLEDALNIQKECKTTDSVAIIGGGLVGLDAAMGLINKNIELHLIEMADRILPLQLDKQASKPYEEKLKEKGVKIHTGVCVQEALIDEEGFIKSLTLNDGSTIKCNMAIVAAGVKPNVDFLKDERLLIDRGIIVDDHGKTSVDSIYAAGDVCSKIGIWPLAVKQAVTAAYNMAGIERVLEDDFGFKNSMNFFGIDTISLGVVNPPDDSYSVDIISNKDVYKKIVHKDGIIYGALLQGDTSYCGVLTQIIKNKLNISNISKDLFHIDYSDFYEIAEDGSFKYA